MAAGKGQKSSKVSGNELDCSTWENVSFKCFFFFFTGSQALLWPWMPVILDKTDFTHIQTGATICIAIIGEVAGVKLASYRLKKTKNGCVRKVFLLSLLFLSVLFSIPTFFILPKLPEHSFCVFKIFPFNIHFSGNESSASNITSVPQYSQNDSFNVVTKQITVLPKFFQTSTLEAKMTSIDDHNIEKNVSTTTIASNHAEMTKTITTSQPERKSETSVKVKSETTPEVKVEVTSKVNSIDQNQLDDSSKNKDKKTANLLPKQTFTFNESLPTSQSEDESSVNLKKYKHTQTTKNSRIGVSQYAKTLTTHGSDRSNSLSKSLYLSSSNPIFPYDSTNTDNNFADQKPPKPPSIFESKSSSFTTSPSTTSRALIYYDGSYDDDTLYEYYNQNPYKRRDSSNYILRIKRRATDGESAEEPISVGTRIGLSIAILFILSSFMQGGIDTSMSKLWFSIRYGQPHDLEPLEEFDLTIVPNMHLAAIGDHKKWSLFTRAFWIVCASVSVGIFCNLSSDLSRPFMSVGIFHGIAGIMSCFVILFIPMPHGSLQNAKTRRPLSLYLDDEVIREGLRRVSFHVWVLTHGILVALPYFYNVWFLKQSEGTEGEIFCGQTFTITLLYVGEAVIYPNTRWITRKLGIVGTIFVTGFTLWTSCLGAFLSSNLWLRGLATFSVGHSVAYMWIAIQNNALLLGNSGDQEKEVWASWACFKIGLSAGAILWPAALNMNWSSGSVKQLFYPMIMFGVTTTTLLILITLFTRHNQKGRRRMYHTLDLNNASSEEDASTEEEAENDWLVKRAKKDGLKL